MASRSQARREGIRRGFGTDTRPLAGELWAREARQPDAPALSATGNIDPDNRSLDYARYYDRDYAKAELDFVWQKTWLYACREEDLPNVGDRVPFSVGPLSWFIVRVGEDAFKAFNNSCLHRGTRLCAAPGPGSTIKCPYHGWEWSIDGRLKRIPSHWDFPDIARQDASLPEVKVGRWGGFIFINADKDAAPLEEALGVIPDHFREFAPEKRYTAARFRKTVRANWKIVQEAFQEAYHLYTTHPEAVPSAADAQTQYDIWSYPNSVVGRNAGCSAMPSAHAPSEATALTATAMFAEAIRDWHYPDGDLPEWDENGDLRAQLGDWHRAQVERKSGQASNVADAVLIDSMLYFLFPHACFWLSEAVPFTYQFTPHPTDPEQSFFEVRMLLTAPPGAPPPSSPLIELDADESVFEKAPAFGFLGYVFDQDMSNMPLVQLGVHAADPEHPYTRLGVYQESIIQHWNRTLDDMIADARARSR